MNEIYIEDIQQLDTVYGGMNAGEEVLAGGAAICILASGGLTLAGLGAAAAAYGLMGGAFGIGAFTMGMASY